MLAAGVGGQSERLAGHRRKMAVESRVTQEEIKKEPEKPIDREKVRGPDTVAAGRRGGARGLRAGAAGTLGGRAASARALARCPARRRARCCCASSPPTTAATTEWTSSPAGTCRPVSCRSTPGERAARRAGERAAGVPGPARGRRCRGGFWLSGATLGRSPIAEPFAHFAL